MQKSDLPIDWQHLQEFSGGDEEFEWELISLFVNDSQPRLETLKAAIASNDFGEVEQTAHHLKGSSANVGIPIMQAAASQLEQQARAQQLVGTPELVSDLETTLGQISTFLASSSAS